MLDQSITGCRRIQYGFFEAADEAWGGAGFCAISALPPEAAQSRMVRLIEVEGAVDLLKDRYFDLSATAVR